jgi:hypothetical protein
LIKTHFRIKYSLLARFALAGLAINSLSTLGVAQTAQPVALCDGLKKFVNGKAATPFTRDHGAVVESNMWKARTQIAQGDCKVRSHSYVCLFNDGPAEADLASSYQAKVGDVQACLNSLDSRFDWRKREGSEKKANGATLTWTRWIRTTLRDQQERKVEVSNYVGGSRPGDNSVSVLWHMINVDSDNQ